MFVCACVYVCMLCVVCCVYVRCVNLHVCTCVYTLERTCVRMNRMLKGGMLYPRALTKIHMFDVDLCLIFGFVAYQAKKC